METASVDNRPRARAGGHSAPGGGHLVDLLCALDREMHEVERVYPAVGPAPIGPREEVAQVAERLGVRRNDRLALAVHRWLAQRRRFAATVAAVEKLDHGHLRQRIDTHVLTDRLCELREARRRLDELATELRDEVGRAIDDAGRFGLPPSGRKGALKRSGGPRTSLTG